MNVLVVAAHPDDEVLGAGGTMARFAAEGHRVFLAILGEGLTSRYKNRCEAARKELGKLKQNAARSAKILGAEEPLFFDLPDNRFDTVPLLEVVKIVEGVKRKIRPELILTHHRGDLNVDHQITFKAVVTASRPLAGESVKRILSFEVLSSTEWASPKRDDYFQPNVFTDIRRTLRAKIKAMECYESEIARRNHPRSPVAIRTLAKRRGLSAGLTYAEAFEMIREIQK
jgi:LmbE family N-acetylglucosaminyl deacetylase